MINKLGRIVAWGFFISLGLCACQITTTESAESSKEIIKPVPHFKQGDKVVFIGDSITHGGSYHKNIFLFNATRYPNKVIDYHNAGISGDTALGTANRYQQDIAIHKPSVATIMLGMNDVSRELYKNKSKHQTEIIQARKQYLLNMNKLAKLLKNDGVEVIFITPSIFDQTAELASDKLVGINDELQNYGFHLEKLAKRYNGSIVDFQQPMLLVNKVLQAKKPSASVVGKDRVHPGENGHLVMTYAFLAAQQESQFVSKLSFDAKTKQITDAKNTELLGKVMFNQASISFTSQDFSLPFPVTQGQKSALEWVPFQQRFNQQVLQVTSLNQGDYQLFIDDILVGKYSAADLAKGINLAANSDTPMYQQALKVKDLNDQRAAKVGKIRDIAHIKYYMLSRYPDVDPNNQAQAKVALNDYLRKSINQPWYEYFNNQINKYYQYVNHEAEIRTAIDQLKNQIYQINKPKTHQWRLSKI